jgi:hypothetical protein
LSVASSVAEAARPVGDNHAIDEFVGAVRGNSVGFDSLTVIVQPEVVGESATDRRFLQTICGLSAIDQTAGYRFNGRGYRRACGQSKHADQKQFAHITLPYRILLK